MRYIFSALSVVASASAGTLLWDGRAPTAADLSAWSFSNAVGVYQYYIHGSGTNYTNLDAAYKNPADTGSSTGIKISLDSTSYWNGQTMRRTELIPQSSTTINAGKVYYHFSMSRKATNAPSEFKEHQIAFFESHFTEMKSGWQSGASGTSDPALRWNANSATQWNTTWEADVWHNVAYGIDFSANTVEFYHSTGGDDLVLTVPAVSVTASSDGKDFHVGVLELPRDGYADENEDIYFSGVYIESGDVTLSVSGPAGSVSASGSVSLAVAASTSSPATQAAVMSTTAMPVMTPASTLVDTSSVAPTSAKPTESVTATTLQTMIKSSTTVEQAVVDATTIPTSTTTAPVTSSSSVPTYTTSTTTEPSVMAQIQAYIIAILMVLKHKATA